MGKGRVLGRVPDDREVKDEPSPPPSVAMPESSTAQRIGTSKERSQIRWGELLRPTTCERYPGLSHRGAV